MRPIKFRAWDKENRRMLSGNDGVIGAENYSKLLLNLNGELFKVYAEKLRHSGSSWFDMPWKVSDYELMQFTGLLDREGKEIYEGDIIKVADDSIWLVEPISSLERDGTYYGLCVSPNGNGENYWLDKSIWAGEVIGNIYENPVLIK